MTPPCSSALISHLQARMSTICPQWLFALRAHAHNSYLCRLHQRHGPAATELNDKPPFPLVSTLQLLAAGHFGWVGGKVNAYLGGPVAQQRYFRLYWPTVACWLASALQSQNTNGFILPLGLSFAYGYFLFVHDFKLDKSRSV